jgi:hypothetical protein
MLPNPAPYFANLPDPRRETKNKHFALSEILTIALCAGGSGMDDWKSVADFAQDKLAWFRQFLALDDQCLRRSHRRKAGRALHLVSCVIQY